MKDLIEALTILQRYGDTKWPVTKGEDVLVLNPSVYKPEEVTKEDKLRLAELGFLVWLDSPKHGGESVFYSFRFGSC